MKGRFKLIAAAYLVLRQGDSVLLSRRYNTGFHDGEYSLPAGHLDGNETLGQAAVREAHEELGIDLIAQNLTLIHVLHRKETDGERMNFFFAADVWRGEPKIREPNKCDELRWFVLSDLPANIIPYVQHALQNIHRGNSYSEYGW